MGDNCDLCYKFLKIASNNGMDHDACHDEWNSRFFNGFCTRCGETPVTERHACDSCIESNAKYKNYFC